MDTALKYSFIVFSFIHFFAFTLDAQDVTSTKIDEYEVDKSKPVEKIGFELIWNDEFNNDGNPDSNNWGYEYGFVRNHELQWYQAQNANCKDGRLVIEGRKEKIDNTHYKPNSDDWRTNRQYAEYSSSCVTTKGHQEWPGEGYFEIRARIDTSSGSWPAIWLLGTQGRWPFCGEIDIMEFYRINKVPNILANTAWGSEKSHNGEWDGVKKPLHDFLISDPDWCKKFHLWSMLWNEESINIFLDSQLMNEIPMDSTLNPNGENPFSKSKKFYLLLNLAIGSNGGDPSESKLPLTFEIDYVRIYKSR